MREADLPGAAEDFHGYSQGLSLISGWLPVVIHLLLAAVLITAIGWRNRRWRVLWLPIALGLGVLTGVGLMLTFYSGPMSSDPLPPLIWVWMGALVTSIAVFVFGWRRTPWWRRALSVLAIPCALLGIMTTINQWVGDMPTVRVLYETMTGAPLPEQVSEAQLPALRGKGSMMDSGRMVPIDVPATGSNFPHRREYVYLPPAWFRGPQPPQLPAVMMIPGAYNTPADWVRSGDALSVVDNYTHEHNGYSPIFVFVDPNGDFGNDTECVNGPRGNSADHLVKDVPPYVSEHFGVPADPQRWGVEGWSMGGTCGNDLAAMHPELLHSVVDIAGDPSPSTVPGDRNRSIEDLFGGDEKAWENFDPATVMRRHGPYSGVAAWVDEAADSGPERFAEAHQLCGNAAKVDIQCAVHTHPGSHSWQYATSAFADSLPWLDKQVNAPDPAPAPAPPPATAPAPPNTTVQSSSPR